MSELFTFVESIVITAISDVDQYLMEYAENGRFLIAGESDFYAFKDLHKLNWSDLLIKNNNEVIVHVYMEKE